MPEEWSRQEPIDQFDQFYEERRDPTYEAHKAWLLRLHETKRHADSDIVCGGQTFKVHSFLFSTRSEVFEGLYNGNFEEARTKRINLPEDDPYMIYRMILYLYMMDYPDTQFAPIIPPDDDWRNIVVPSHYHNSTPKPPISANPIESVNEATWTSSFNTNVRMYILADKYDVVDLKDIAEKKIHRLVKEARDNQNPNFEQELLQEIPLIYEVIPAYERGLRNCVLDYVKSHWVRLSLSEDLRDLFSEAPEFGVELVTTMTQSYLYKGTCQRCRRTDKWTAERVRCLCGCAETV